MPQLLPVTRIWGKQTGVLILNARTFRDKVSELSTTLGVIGPRIGMNYLEKAADAVLYNPGPWNELPPKPQLIGRIWK